MCQSVAIGYIHSTSSGRTRGGKKSLATKCIGGIRAALGKQQSVEDGSVAWRHSQPVSRASWPDAVIRRTRWPGGLCGCKHWQALHRQSLGSTHPQRITAQDGQHFEVHKPEQRWSTMLGRETKLEPQSKSAFQIGFDPRRQRRARRTKSSRQTLSRLMLVAS
mmetsp:Transcript_47919/g.111795  ORF Transcript_47919/g.111795 Transcript_47919/m.111795 type:complete len:163 (-) Transcript_47919:42-530(-)